MKTAHENQKKCNNIKNINIYILLRNDRVDPDIAVLASYGLGVSYIFILVKIYKPFNYKKTNMTIPE